MHAQECYLVNSKNPKKEKKKSKYRVTELAVILLFSLFRHDTFFFFPARNTSHKRFQLFAGKNNNKTINKKNNKNTRFKEKEVYTCISC